MPLRSGAVLFALVLALGVVRLSLNAQAPNASAAFDLVSIKRSSGLSRPMQIESGGHFVATNVPLIALVVNAFPVRRDQLLGLPGWATNDRFNIDATVRDERKLPVTTVRDSKELPALLRALLANRFNLRTHLESRQEPVYALVPATNRPELTGSQIQHSTTNCDDPGVHCGRQQLDADTRNRMGRARKSVLMDTGATMSELAEEMSEMWDEVGRPVVDRTEMSGRYDFMLLWTPGDGSFQATLRQQLGLKLESARSPIDFLVIDHVEHPSKD